MRALTAAATRLAAGDFSASIPPGGAAEVGTLARTMEDMRRNLIELTSTLRRREAEAQAVLGGIVEGVYAVDKNRIIRYLNPQAQKLLGVTRGARRSGASAATCSSRRPRTAAARASCAARSSRHAAPAAPRPSSTSRAARRGAAHHGHHQRRAGRWPAGAGDPRRDRARGGAARTRLGARQHLARVPHAARRAARLDRAVARGPGRHGAGAAARAGELARARHAAPHAADRQSARERAHRVRAAGDPRAARGAAGGGGGRPRRWWARSSPSAASGSR